MFTEEDNQEWVDQGLCSAADLSQEPVIDPSILNDIKDYEPEEGASI